MAVAADDMLDDDKDLMARICSGDHQAFATLVRAHTERFYRVAYRMCGHEEEAEDIVQDAFLKLWNKPENWDHKRGAKFTTWFYRVVTNLALDRQRKKKPQYGSDVVELLPDDAPNQQQNLQQKQEQDVLETAIQRLPERQKAALNLCFYEELSNKEAADILGVGVKALESLLMRAKVGLRDELTRNGFMRKQEDGGEAQYG